MQKNKVQTKEFNLNSFINEIRHLQEAKELIQEVFLEIGAYGTGEISEELRYKINDYMDFDDSE